MGNNIEKIGLVNPNDNNILHNKGIKFPSYIKIKADCEIEIVAIKNTGTDFRPKWIAKPRKKGPFTAKDMNGHTGDIMGAKIEAKYCGAQKYHIEAFADAPINREPNRIIVQGQAPQKITLADWRKSKTGSSLGSTPNKFGDDIWLHLETEGLNGNRLNIAVFNEQWGDDGYVASYTAKCYGGEVNLNIKDTYKWRAGTGWITSNNENFYVKIKVVGKRYYITDKGGNDRIAEHIVFKDKITTRITEKYTSDLPVKVDQNEINLERYEPCRFKKITVTDEGETIELFEEGKLKIDEDHKKDFAVSEKIYFDFEKWNIKPGAKEVLDGIATFLLDSPFVPVTLGAHCDSRGTDEYNDKLSNNRAIAAVEYLVGKGVSRTRITARGYGKRRPYIKGDNLSEAEHQLNRRVTVQFNIYGGDAESIIYNTVASDITKKKEIVLKVGEYNVKKCLRKGLSDAHGDKVYVVEFTKQGKSNPEDYSKDNVNHKIYSNLLKDTFIPFDYIWLSKSITTNNFLYYISSCRYYSDPKKAAVIVKVYPDIKWELAAELAIGVSNYKAANVPSGSIYQKHNEKAREAGYTRWQLNKTGKLPIDIGLGLSVEWNNGDHKRSYTQEFKKKIQPLAETLSTFSEIVQNAINYAQSTAKATAIPVGFDMRYPKFKVAASWFFKRDDKANQIVTAGELSLSFDPLIGAEAVVDIIGMAIAAASYGATGNPAAARLINNFRGGLDKLGASVTFEATFYGELKFEVLALKFDTLNGFSLGGKTTIGGRFGVTIELSIDIELGKLAGAKTKPIVSFKAGIKGDGYFGGDIEIDSDDSGIFVQPVVKFSGIMIVGEIEGEIGWWKSSFKMEEKVMPGDEKKFDKKYLF